MANLSTAIGPARWAATAAAEFTVASTVHPPYERSRAADMWRIACFS
jgi:hypothetical protein